ncbi:hypothetical protein SAMN05216378_2576 [Paenibacillus catalpae]|uniref:Uncharacterized protein n=1 Tax=Paenibacillus catalpae TaxID=1045775 RepID=A0A1I1YBR0_9BACL|nr:hypothetical protein SAMN05216378_2576 [Paenibacillus catalpae]
MQLVKLQINKLKKRRSNNFDESTRGTDPRFLFFPILKEARFFIFIKFSNVTYFKFSRANLYCILVM